jgi:hypothetical protein
MARVYSKMNYGFRVSLPGKDVLTCDDKDVVITSKAPCLKIIETDEIPFDAEDAEYLQISVRHNSTLPFVVLAFYYNSGVEAWKEPSQIQFDNSYLYFTIQEQDIMTDPSLIYFILYG